MNDPLLEATKALRETTNGEPLAIGRYTRARVLSSVRLQNRRGIIRFAFGVPLAALLIGSGAWAASGHSLPVFVQRVSVVLGLREPEPPGSSQRPASAVAAEGSKVSPGESLSLPEGESAALAAVDASLPEGESAVDSEAAASKQRPARPRAALAQTAMTELDFELYGRAHRAHFVDRNMDDALAAWSEYLRQFPRGRFGIEAAYNRALCLVRLGRHAEAKRALEPFARGARGDYRRVEAAALMAQLPAD